jgi:hypothetical protein
MLGFLMGRVTKGGLVCGQMPFAPVPSGSRYGLDQVVGTVREGGKGSRLRPRVTVPEPLADQVVGTVREGGKGSRLRPRVTVPEPLAGSGGAQGLRGRRRATRATGHRYPWAA